jgi:hypothetical protein
MKCFEESMTTKKEEIFKILYIFTSFCKNINL